jgi:purine-binding chemotaxis protein CheW
MATHTHAYGEDADALAPAGKEFLSFRLGQAHYGIDLLKVREIRRYEAPTRMPNSAPVFLGMLDIRGDIVPIWDARLKLGMGAVNYTAQTLTVVLTLNQQLVGLVVDEVSDIARIPLQDIQPVRTGETGVHPKHLLGVAATGAAEASHMLILLDVDQLISPPVDRPTVASALPH